MDYLSGIIFKISTDLGEQSSAALWGRTLKILHSQLQKRLRDYAQGERSLSCWPSLGRLLLLQLLGRVFSVTDLKNDIVAPATLLLCQCLSQCPVSTIADLSSGLLSCTILLFYHSEAKRYIPEVVAFINTAISLYLPENEEINHNHYQNTFNRNTLNPLRSYVCSMKTPENINKIEWVLFSNKKEIIQDKERIGSYNILTNLYNIILKITQIYENNIALPEIIEPVLQTLKKLSPQMKNSNFPIILTEKHLNIIQSILSLMNNINNKRNVLQYRKKILHIIETKQPRFQLDYTFKKDNNNQDAEQIKVKQLTRQLKREKKAAMRELRRDSDFIDNEKYQELQAAKEFRRAERVKNYGLMEEQQATINLQVRKGNGLMKGGGSGVVKKSRPKRL